jgi:hypothetical protein
MYYIFGVSKPFAAGPEHAFATAGFRRGAARHGAVRRGCNRAAPGEAEWEAQLARLAAHMKAVHGDCSVPQGWAEDARLASWVGTQRRLKRELDRGGPCEGITAEQVARLMGLSWHLRCPRCRAEEEGRGYGGPHWADRDCDAAPEDRATPEDRCAANGASFFEEAP